MEENNKKNFPIVFYILGFIVAVFFELYWIGNFPYDYFMLIGIGLVVLITGYLTFDGIIKAYNEAQEIKRQQNEIMIKAQKAIYLATKKNSAESEKMQINSLKAVNLLMDRMVDTITEKQIGTKAGYPADMTGLIAELTESNAKLAKEVQNAITVGQLVKANENLIRNVQDVLSGKTDLSFDIEPSVQEENPVLESDLAINHIAQALNEVTLDETNDSSLDNITLDTADDSSISDITPDTADDGSMDQLTIDTADNTSIEDMALEEPDSLDSMEEDIASAEAAVADMSQTVEAMEAADDMDKDPNAALSPEEIAKLFENI